MKRSLFGSFSLWGRSAPEAATAEPDRSMTDGQIKGDSAHASSTGMFDVKSVFASPAKMATVEQMQTRKIHSRPQGPTSKLGLGMKTVNEYSRVAQGDTPMKPKPVASLGLMADGTPKRMPGDNPYKKYPEKAPAATASRPATHFAASTSTPRRLLRGNAMRSSMTQRPGISFSPDLPPNVMRSRFPQNTTGKAPPGPSGKANPRSFTCGENELFHQQIPSPPASLTGEALLKEVPGNHDRPGSIFADEFLAHYCPSHFTDLQRRQFFCILDLRRLKFVSDGVWTSRTWKINAINFAEEYEKSRSIIMLRYGLYQFKTVRVTESVKREWQAKHGIVPESEPSTALAAAATGAGSKRKADAPTAQDIFSPSTNVNKRARATDRVPLPETNVLASNKNKRKVSVEDAEEQAELPPSKLQKSAPASSPPKNPPSATKAIFEQIANNSIASPTPNKSPAKASILETAEKGDLGKSVFDSGAKAPVANNIFGHLSDNGRASGNDDAESEQETEADSEAEAAEEEVEKQAPPKPLSPAKEGALAPGSGLFAKKSFEINGASSVASSDAGDSAKSRSIFERLSYGTDGQPLRVDTPQPAVPADTAKPASPAKEPAPPADQTWNTATPIKFAAAAAAAAAAAPQAAFESTTPPAPASSASALFGVGKKADESTEDPKATAKSLFGSASQPAPKNGALGASTAAAGSAVKLFGGNATSGTSGFGQGLQNAASPAPASALFGSKLAETPKASIFNATQPAPAASFFPSTEPKKSLFVPAEPANSHFDAKATEPGSAPPKSLFAGLNTPLTAAAPSAAVQAKTVTEQPAPKQPSVFQSSTLFGSKPDAAQAQRSAHPLFGAPKSDAAQEQAPVQKFFGAQEPGAGKEATLFAGLKSPGNAGPLNQSFQPGTGLFSNMANAANTKVATEVAPSGTSLFAGSTTAQSTATRSALGALGTGAEKGGQSTVTKAFASFGKAAEDDGDDRLKDDRPAKKRFGGDNAGAGAASTKDLFSFGTKNNAFVNGNTSFSSNVSSMPATASQDSIANPGQDNASQPQSVFANQSGPSVATSASGLFQFGNSVPAPSQSTTSFTFGASKPFGGQKASEFHNPFTTGSAPSISFDFVAAPSNGASFGASQTENSQPSTRPFSFSAGGISASNSPFAGAGANTPSSGSVFAANSQASGSQPIFGTQSGTSGGIFSFGGGGVQPAGGPTAQASAGNMFAFGPGAGTSTGTSKSRSAKHPRPVRRFR